MKEKISWSKMMKIFFFLLFVSAPSIVITGYLVFELRGWLASTFGFEVSDRTYLFVLLLSIWAAAWLSTGSLIKKLQSIKS